MVNEWTADGPPSLIDVLEACRVAQSYKVDAYQATERAEAAERELDEWKSRAEAAEARTAPAVSRADVAEALSRCINPEMWNVTFPSVVSEVCDLFGVEAEQAVDPLLDKAQEFAALADWELTDREAELLHAVAAHVLGQEEGDEGAVHAGRTQRACGLDRDRSRLGRIAHRRVRPLVGPGESRREG